MFDVCTLSVQSIFAVPFMLQFASLYITLQSVGQSSCFSAHHSPIPTTERCQSRIEVLGTVCLKVESTGAGDPLPGLMGNEGSSDPFSPARAPQPPLNYTAGVSVFAWSITSQPLHLLSCTHRLQDNQCPKLPG